jgi:hypothetical protein
MSCLPVRVLRMGGSDEWQCGHEREVDAEPDTACFDQR